MLFVGWFLLLGLFLVGLIAGGDLPVDYRTYHLAAEKIGRTESPYGSPADSQAVWAKIHQLSRQLYRNRPPPGETEVQSGPYLYSPTLALLLQQLRLNAILFTTLVFGAVIGFGWLWLRASQRNAFQPSAWWLLFIVFSWDVAASYLGLNVELILLALGLSAAWLLWHGRGLLAALPIAFVVLIKPFFALLIAAFGLLMLLQRPERRRKLRVVALAAGGGMILIMLEVLRWPGWLREAAYDYFRNALMHQWLVLPLPEQTPMSIWNRAPLQLLVNLGIEATLAQWLALLLWAILLLVSLWKTHRCSLSFAHTFALAYILFLWGRPVSWTLPYLEIVLLLALWPYTRTTWQQTALLIAVGALTASHWLALVRTALAINANLFTLQTASIPWETVLFLPLCWLLLVLAAEKAPTESSGATLGSNGQTQDQ